MDALRQPCNLTGEFAHLSTLTSRVIDRVLSESGSTEAPLSLPVPTSIREYQILSELGKGGMGSVYLAKHLRLHRNVALKLLPDHLAADPQFRGRFEREMAVVGQLDHPNLVSARDAGIEANRLFLVMELLEGANFAALVEKTGPLAPADACEAIRQAALGLHFAHEHGMVHRDVKPGNLFLTKLGVVKVIDLGLARVHNLETANDKLSSMQTTLGTPHYMAPEQWEDAPGVDFAADIYALGCTLFFLLTGEPPFASRGGKSWVALFEAHRSETPASVRSRRSDVPMGLDRLIARTLAKNPKNRPASALALSEELAPFTAGQALSTLLANDSPRLLAAPSRGYRFFKTGQTWKVVAATVLTAILLSGWLLWYTGTRHAGSPPVRADSTHESQTPDRESLPLELHPSRILREHQGAVLALALSPDGKTLASGGADRSILLWDTTTWKSRGPLLGHPGDVMGLAFTRDGAKLASVCSSPDTCAIRLWDVATAQPAGVLGGESLSMFCLSCSSDGQTWACGGHDLKLHMFDVATGRERLVIPTDVSRHVRALSFSADGRQIVCGGSGPTRIWDTRTGEEVPMQIRLPDELNPTFLPDGSVAGWLYYFGRITHCSVPSGEILAAWQTNPGILEGMASSPDGRMLASLGPDGAAKIWATLDQRQLASLVGHKGNVYVGAFSPDGKKLFTGGLDDRTIQEWDLTPVLSLKN